MSNDAKQRLTVSRRDLLSVIGAVSGSAAMYHAMTSLGFASDSGYKGPIKLDGDPKGASVLILGAGLAGMTAALELRKAGYKVQILEFNNRPGGRNWTLRGGDSFTELGDFKQTCEFEQGLYFNPAHGGFRITIARSSITASAWVSPLSRSSNSITTPFCTRPRRSEAFRSAFATSRPISRDKFRNCLPRQRSRASSTKLYRKKIAKS